MPITFSLSLEEKEMKPEAKQQWIKALQSRKYRKGNSRWLHTKQNYSSKFSALGVLTDLYMKEKEHQWSYVLDKHYDEEDVPVYVGLSSSKRVAVDNEVRGKLSPLVMRWAGLEDSVATLPNLSNLRVDQREKINSIGASIAALDDSGMSFKQMASVIDKAYFRSLKKAPIK